jgi:hypothetical protein
MSLTAAPIKDDCLTGTFLFDARMALEGLPSIGRTMQLFVRAEGTHVLDVSEGATASDVLRALEARTGAMLLRHFV